MVILHLHILCVLLLLKLTIPASTAKSAYLYFSMHKSVQVHLLYYVVGAECISLYLGPTKIQQSRLVVFIALWIPCNPGLVAPSMHATSAPTTVCTLAWLVDFIVFLAVALIIHGLLASKNSMCFVVVEVDNICIDRWICKSLLVKMICCCSKSA